MKNVRKNIKMAQLRKYLNELGLDEKELLSMNRMTAKGFDTLNSVFHHFTKAKVKKGVGVELDRTRDDGTKSKLILETEIKDWSQVDSMPLLLSEINNLINGIYEAERRTEAAKHIVKNLSPESEIAFYALFAQAEKTVDDLNAKAKQHGLSLADFDQENLEVLTDFHRASSRLHQLAKTKIELDQNKDEQER